LSDDVVIRDFKVTMLLADAAQYVQGKLYILGGGWSIIDPGTVSFAVAVNIQTAWHRADLQNQFRLELLDSDGNAVVIPTPLGEQPFLVEGGFTAARPDGVKPGTPLDGGFALNVVTQLPPNARLEFRMTINGDSHEEWTLPFTTRAAPSTRS